MLLSTNALLKALKYKKKNKTEGYSKLDSIQSGIDFGFATGFLIIATMFVFMELLVLFYSLKIAITCTSPGPERIIHVVLAMTFTLPYILMTMIFVPCAKQTLTK